MIKTVRLTVFMLFMVLMLVFSGGILSEELTGEEIMKKVDENQFIASGRMEAEMIIIDRGRESTKEMLMFVESDGQVTNGLVEFTNPRDRGTKYLLLDDELWMYFPDAEDLIRISGHMLRDGMMGSDFSYQDALESEQLSELYKFEKEGQEEIEGRRVFVIKATAREDQEPAYHSRRFWVDSERFVILKEEMYARDGRLLKEMITEKVGEITEGRWMPLEMVMEDKLREGSQTVYRIKEIDLDYEIPEGKISLDTLQ